MCAFGAMSERRLHRYLCRPVVSGGGAAASSHPWLTGGEAVPLCLSRMTDKERCVVPLRVNVCLGVETQEVRRIVGHLP
jgi:hypothetical protein